MLQLFRSFQWTGSLFLLAVAVIVRSIFLLELQVVESTSLLGPLGQSLTFTDSSSLFSWIIGVVLITIVGFLASFSLQHYRLGSAGNIPGLVLILLGSALVWWTGYNPMLIGSVLIAFSFQVLFAGYRYQGDALPVYNCGLFVGAAWMVAPGFLWFGLWAAIALTQLRKFRFAEFLNLLFGIFTLPMIFGILAFLNGEYSLYSQSLWVGVAQLPEVALFTDHILSVTVVALLTGAAIGVLSLLTTRRPIQEQRAFQVLYSMLAIGWVALLFSNASPLDGIVFVLYPLGVLLGLWMSELKRRRAELVLLISIALISGGYLWLFLS